MFTRLYGPFPFPSLRSLRCLLFKNSEQKAAKKSQKGRPPGSAIAATSSACHAVVPRVRDERGCLFVSIFATANPCRRGDRTWLAPKREHDLRGRRWIDGKPEGLSERERANQSADRILSSSSRSHSLNEPVPRGKPVNGYFSPIT
jgi:hypothetical protein